MSECKDVHSIMSEFIHTVMAIVGFLILKHFFEKNPPKPLKYHLFDLIGIVSMIYLFKFIFSIF
jgi:hypothetical protein